MHKQRYIIISRFILSSIFFLPFYHIAEAAVGGAYQQDAGRDGIVAIEVEHYDNQVIHEGHSWTAVAPSGFSGSGAVEASPNNGTRNDRGYVSRSPRLDFEVNFTQMGIHYVWVRGRAASGSDDSVHVGLDGNAVLSSNRITGIQTTTWKWSKATMDGPVATIEVTVPGVHTVNLWMREDGAVIDKLLLTTNASYTPSGTGAPESARDNNTATDSESPSVPVGLSGAAIDTSRIDLSWSPSTDTGGSGLAGYRVYRDGVEITTTTTHNYSDTGLAAVTSYGYTVVAYDNAGNSSLPSALVSVTTIGSGSGGGAYQQDPGGDGIVAIEAEHYDNQVTQGEHSWTAVAPSGFSGSGAVEAIPNNGTRNNTRYVSRSPRLDFEVNFTQTGVHYVWVRGRAVSGSDDSVHMGLDGNAVPSSNRITGIQTTTWKWSKATMDGPVATIEVAVPGVHTVNLWMREDGAVIDKLLLTTNASYTPSGTGAPESPRDNNTVTDSESPSVPVGLSGAAIDTSRIDLSWSPSTDTGGSGLAGYRVYRDGVEITTTTTPNYSDTGLAAVTTYGYTVVAYDNAGNSSLPSALVSITTNDTVLSGVTLSWTPPTTNVDGTALVDLAGHKIYYGSSPGSYTNTINVSGPGISTYVIENLIPGTYYFTVTAYDSDGIESTFSSEASKVIN